MSYSERSPLATPLEEGGVQNWSWIPLDKHSHRCRHNKVFFKMVYFVVWIFLSKIVCFVSRNKKKQDLYDIISKLKFPKWPPFEHRLEIQNEYPRWWPRRRNRRRHHHRLLDVQLRAMEKRGTSQHTDRLVLVNWTSFASLIEHPRSHCWGVRINNKRHLCKLSAMFFDYGSIINPNPSRRYLYTCG